MNNKTAAWIRTSVLCTAMASRAAAAFAQQAAPAPAISFNVNVGDHVWVTTADGATTKVLVAGVNPQGLELFARGKRIDLAAADVTLIEKRYRDPVRNGLITGFAVGGAIGALAGLSLAGGCDDCSGGNAGFWSLLAGAEVGVIGLAIGGIGDALIHAKREVYHSRLTLRPVVAKRAAGASLTFRW